MTKVLPDPADNVTLYGDQRGIGIMNDLKISIVIPFYNTPSYLLYEVFRVQ
jgi:hypothetical protein